MSKPNKSFHPTSGAGFFSPNSGFAAAPQSGELGRCRTMRRLLTIIIQVLCISAFCIGHSLADSFLLPTTRVQASPSGTAFFLMASRYSTRPDRTEGSDFGVAYSVERDGKFRKLWRVKGWAAPCVFISDNGRFLVRIGGEGDEIGEQPCKEDIALTFFRDGIIQKQYSTADLVKDVKHVPKSVSHYFWIYSFTPEFLRQAGLPCDAPSLDSSNVFHLMTVDGIQYEFDATTCKILKTTALLTKRSS
jgi:hypothetical protein